MSRPGFLELLLGGARSGKSALAESLAAEDGRPVTYVATAEALDEEMAARIARHRESRPADWASIEAPLALAEALTAHAAPNRLLLADCLTLWLSNLLGRGEEALVHEQEALLATLPTLPGRVILVSNEVGLGIVPDNTAARRFRDEAGRLNQAVAGRADRVIFTAAGLPQVLKGPSL